MRRIDMVVVLAGAFGVVGACSSADERDRDPGVGGAGGDAGGLVGGLPIWGAGGAGGENAGGTGAGGPYGTGEMPTGGAPAIAEWTLASCEALTDDGCPSINPSGKDNGAKCQMFTVERFSAADSCRTPTVERLCLYDSNTFFGSCTAADCPAQPAPHQLFFRELDNGEVELIHIKSTTCNTWSPPGGFNSCQMKPTDPDICHCRCTVD